MMQERLKQARKLRGFSLQELADAMGDITKQALSKFENGSAVPNSTRLIQMAGVLGVSPEYFFRTGTVELETVEFRKLASFGKTKQETVKEQVREHLERYLAVEQLLAVDGSAGKNPPWKKRIPVNSAEEAEKAAEEIRKRWKLGEAPIANLTETMEENGIKVLALDTDEKFDGLCALVNGGEHAVVVSNSKRPGERQRFNLAHELGHLVMELPEAIHDTREEESLCHRFAGAFLFPASQVRINFGSHRQQVLLKEFLLGKEEWGISAQAILHRLHDLGIVSDAFYASTCKHWSARGFRKEEPGQLEAEKTFRLKQLVLRALAEELISPSRGAELLNKEVHEVNDMMGSSQEAKGKDAALHTGH